MVRDERHEDADVRAHEHADIDGGVLLGEDVIENEHAGDGERQRSGRNDGEADQQLGPQGKSVGHFSNARSGGMPH